MVGRLFYAPLPPYLFLKDTMVTDDDQKHKAQASRRPTYWEAPSGRIPCLEPDPSRYNSTSKQNPPIQQNRRNF